MSRSGYSEDGDDNWATIRWRGAVKAAIKGRRGQAFFQALADALDDMPNKRLISNSLQDSATGEVCALGALGVARRLPIDGLDPEDSAAVASVFNIAKALACEVVFENDEGAIRDETPERRWNRMRRWVAAAVLVERRW